jgi:fructokinase
VELSSSSPRYHFHLKGTAAFALDTAETTAAMGAIEHLSALYFGTLGLLVEPMASLGEALVVSAPGDVMVVIDPNCRPSAIEDHDGYRQRVTRLCARADVMKVSTEDVAYLFPGSDALEGARTLLSHGARCVIMTDGAAPVKVLSAQSELLLPVEPTDVVDTVGAGDALVGGFLTWWTGHGLSRHDLLDTASLDAAVRAAIEISRRTCQRAGAQPPHRDEVIDSVNWRWL